MQPTQPYRGQPVAVGVPVMFPPQIVVEIAVLPPPLVNCGREDRCEIPFSSYLFIGGLLVIVGVCIYFFFGIIGLAGPKGNGYWGLLFALIFFIGVWGWFLEKLVIVFNHETRIMTYERQQLIRYCCPERIEVPFDALGLVEDDGFSAQQASTPSSQAFVRSFSIYITNTRTNEKLRVCELSGTREEAAAAVASWNQYIVQRLQHGNIPMGIGSAPPFPAYAV